MKKGQPPTGLPFSHVRRRGSAAQLLFFLDPPIIADLDDGVMLINAIRLGNRPEVYRR